jgi:hypothetical protein
MLNCKLPKTSHCVLTIDKSAASTQFWITGDRRHQHPYTQHGDYILYQPYLTLLQFKKQDKIAYINWKYGFFVLIWTNHIFNLFILTWQDYRRYNLCVVLGVTRKEWRRKKMQLFLRISHSFTIQRYSCANYLRRKNIYPS